MKGPHSLTERCRCDCGCRNGLYRATDRAAQRCGACTFDCTKPGPAAPAEPLRAEEMRATVLRVDWPHRYWLTAAGTSYTLLDAHNPDHRRWLARAAVRLLWSLGCRNVCDVAEPSRTAKPPAQWRHHAALRPATDSEVEAITAPLIGATS